MSLILDYKSGPLIHHLNSHSLITLLLAIPSSKPLSLPPVYLRSHPAPPSMWEAPGDVTIHGHCRLHYRLPQWQTAVCLSGCLPLGGGDKQKRYWCSTFQTSTSTQNPSTSKSSLMTPPSSEALTGTMKKLFSLSHTQSQHMPGRKWVHVVTAHRGECFSPMYA